MRGSLADKPFGQHFEIGLIHPNKPKIYKAKSSYFAYNMNKKRLVYIVVFLFLIATAAADVATNASCQSDFDCLILFDETHYCDLATLMCFQTAEIVATNDTLTIEVPNDPISVQELRTKVTALEATSLQLQLTIDELTQQVTTLNSNVQSLSYDQNQLKEGLKTEIHSVSTGLAAVQQNLDTAQSELAVVEKTIEERQKRSTLLLYLFIGLLVVGIFGTVLYILLHGKAGESNPPLAGYITNSIRKGKKFTDIRIELMKAGWSEEQIRQSYQETLKTNYQSYLRKNSSSVPSSSLPSSASASMRPAADKDTTKILSIAIVSVLLLVGVFFLIRGVTGKAIHFQSVQELDAATASLLTSYLDNSDLYPLVSFAKICVEVTDRDKSVSYAVLKTPLGHAVEKAPAPCSNDPTYDFALKFTEWNTFNYVVRKLDCKNLKNGHELLANGLRGYYLLPSKYILPGFTLNSAADYAPFCAAAQACAPAEQLLQAGIKC